MELSPGLLATLTPAETLYLLKPQSTLRELLKFTLTDLLLQEQLDMVQIDRNPVQGETRLADSVLVAGKKFKAQEPKLHEMVFLYPYFKKPRRRIVLRHLIQIAMSVAQSESHFKEKLLTRSPEMKESFRKNWWQRIFGGQTLSPKGKASREALVRQLNVLDKELPVLMKTDREKATLVLKQIKGNICLLNSFKFEMVSKLGQEMLLIEEELEGGPSTA
jgi:hypothetical protein